MTARRARGCRVSHLRKGARGPTHRAGGGRHAEGCDSRARAGALGCRTRRSRPCRAGRAGAEEAGVRARAAGAEPCARRSWSVLPPARHPSLVHPSICLRVHHPSVCRSIHPPVIYPPTCLPPMHTPQRPPPICPSICLSTCASIRPSPLPSVLPSTGPPGVCRATSVYRGCRAEQGDGAPGVPGRVRQGGALGPVGVPRALRRLQRQWGPCTAEGGRGYGLGTQGEGRGPDEGAWLWGAGRSWARLRRRTPSWARPPHRHPCWGALARGPPAPRAPHGRKRGAGLAVMAACGGARPASSAFVKVQAVGWG